MTSQIMTTQITPAAGRSMATSIRVIDWICRLVAAVILLQTLFFKFTAAPESVYIFTKLGTFIHGFLPFVPVQMVQVSARIGSGVMELIAAVLLLTPRWTWVGAILAMAATAGAVASHLTFLGIEVEGDKGLLFLLAVTVFATAAIVLYRHRVQLPGFGKRS